MFTNNQRIKELTEQVELLTNTVGNLEKVILQSLHGVESEVRTRGNTREWYRRFKQMDVGDNLFFSKKSKTFKQPVASLAFTISKRYKHKYTTRTVRGGWLITRIK